MRSDEVAGRVGSPLADVPPAPAERGGPGGDVRRLAAGADVRRGRDVVSRRKGALEPHDDVQEEIAERADERARLRAGHPRIVAWT